MLTFVVTPTMRQFFDYCRINRLDPEACRWVSSAQILECADLSADRVVFWGDCSAMPCFEAIANRLAGNRAAA